jgi:hypothetical protein
MFETKAGIIKPIVYVGIINDNRLLLVDYVTAPNPNKTGWWIPAPGLEFGDDPKEKAESVANDFGLTVLQIKLIDVESFVLPTGWHLIWHYQIQTNSEPSEHPNIKQYKWVTSEQLAEMHDMAHGKWEIGVGKRFLGASI